MAMSQEDYRQQLQALLPQGAAWTREPEATLTALLEALSAELARIDARGGVLLDEADPRTCFEMLSDWEGGVGLPDPCTGTLGTLAERRAALTAKLVSLGGQSRAFFVELAATLGYQVTITEFPVATATTLAAGDGLGTTDSQYVWRVDAPAESVRSFRTGKSAVGERLQSWGNSLLECAISRLKPAHTEVLFGYGG